MLNLQQINILSSSPEEEDVFICIKKASQNMKIMK